MGRNRPINPDYFQTETLPKIAEEWQKLAEEVDATDARRQGR
jgi:hypothetical protein